MMLQLMMLQKKQQTLNNFSVNQNFRLPGYFYKSPGRYIFRKKENLL